MAYTPSQEHFIKSTINADRLSRALDAKPFEERNAILNELATICDPQIPKEPSVVLSLPESTSLYHRLLAGLRAATDNTQRALVKKGAELREIFATQDVSYNFGFSAYLDSSGVPGLSLDAGISVMPKGTDITVIMPLLTDLCQRIPVVQRDVSALLARRGLPSFMMGTVPEMIRALPDADQDPMFKQAVAEGFRDEAEFTRALTGMLQRKARMQAERDRESANLSHIDTIANNGIILIQALIGAKNPKAAVRFAAAAKVTYTIFSTAIAVARNLISPTAAVANLSSILPVLSGFVTGGMANPTDILLKEMGVQINAICEQLHRLQGMSEEILTQLREISRKLEVLDAKIDAQYFALTTLLQVHFEESVKGRVTTARLQLTRSLTAEHFVRNDCETYLTEVAAIAETAAPRAAMTGLSLPVDADSVALTSALIPRGTISNAMALLPALARHLGNAPGAHAGLPHPFLWAYCTTLFLQAQIIAREDLINPSLIANLRALEAQGQALNATFKALSTAAVIGYAKTAYVAAARVWGEIVINPEWLNPAMCRSIKAATDLDVIIGGRELAFHQIFDSDEGDSCKFFGQICGGYEFPSHYEGHFAGVGSGAFFTPYGGSVYKAVLFKEYIAGRYECHKWSGYDLLQGLCQLGYLVPYDEARDLSAYSHNSRAKYHHGNYPAHEDRVITFRFSGRLAGITLAFPTKSHNTDTATRGHRYMVIDCSGKQWTTLNYPELTIALRGQAPERFIDFLMVIYSYALSKKMEEPLIKSKIVKHFISQFSTDSMVPLDRAALLLGIPGRIVRWRRGMEVDPVIGGSMRQGRVCLYDGNLHDLESLSTIFVDHRIAGGDLPGLETLVARLNREFQNVSTRFDTAVAALTDAQGCPVVDQVLAAIVEFRAQKLFLRTRYQALLQAQMVDVRRDFITAEVQRCLELEITDPTRRANGHRIEALLNAGAVPTHALMKSVLELQKEEAFDVLKPYSECYQQHYSLISFAIYMLNSCKYDANKTRILTRMANEMIAVGFSLDKEMGCVYKSPATGAFDSKIPEGGAALDWAARYKFWAIVDNILAKKQADAEAVGRPFEKVSLLNECMRTILTQGALSGVSEAEEILDGLRLRGATITLDQVELSFSERARIIRMRYENKKRRTYIMRDLFALIIAMGLGVFILEFPNAKGKYDVVGGVLFGPIFFAAVALGSLCGRLCGGGFEVEVEEKEVTPGFVALSAGVPIMTAILLGGLVAMGVPSKKIGVAEAIVKTGGAAALAATNAFLSAKLAEGVAAICCSGQDEHLHRD
jgi:hypothetical protein